MVYVLLYIHVDVEVPYDFRFVAANVRGCGETYVADAFFTKEGSMLLLMFGYCVPL